MSHSSATRLETTHGNLSIRFFFISFVCLTFMCTLSGKLGVVSHSSSDFFFALRGAQPFLLPRNLSTLSSRTFIAMMAIAILVVASISGSCFSCNVYTCDLDVAMLMLTNGRLFYTCTTSMPKPECQCPLFFPLLNARSIYLLH